jgi:hypothetical protein
MTTIRILTKHGERKELASLFQVSQPTIRAALNGESITELALKIRKAAIERGGIEVEIPKVDKSVRI